ncbi:MAG: hypothetical protein IKV02_00885 [Clostridia bacterium]|nr:hypothetical protein [Clostridia bacterium]
MSVPIPNYLKHMAVFDKCKSNWTYFSIECTCGCNRFEIYENHPTKEENALLKPYYEAWDEIHANKPRKITVDENGNKHYWRLFEPLKGLDGAHEEIIVPERPFFSGITVIKVKCTECGKEHVVFDNRLHGYDGMAGEETKETLEYEPHFKRKCKDIVSLYIKIENDESFEEFQENTDLGFSEEQYSDAFSWITIYKVNEFGKKAKIFDWESA